MSRNALKMPSSSGGDADVRLLQQHSVEAHQHHVQEVSQVNEGTKELTIRKKKTLTKAKTTTIVISFLGLRHPKKPSRSLQGKRETKIRVPGSLHRL